MQKVECSFIFTILLFLKSWSKVIYNIFNFCTRESFENWKVDKLELNAPGEMKIDLKWIIYGDDDTDDGTVLLHDNAGYLDKSAKVKYWEKQFLLTVAIMRFWSLKIIW